MGEVYQAHDARLNRDVAIKVLPKSLSADPERLLRFEQEAKVVAALNHPNILSIYQMGTHGGSPYLVLELLEGRTLTEVLRRGPLPLRETINYGVQIAHGLAAAHDKGIVHRDLKPDNLFVTNQGRVKILDFGLAKPTPHADLVNQAPTITIPGTVMGTVGYMAPEQVRGMRIDQRSDIFALGAILCEMVVGRQTFERPTSADTISAILNEEPPPISQLTPETPVALERVVRRCLEKAPGQRFHSASDLAFALEALAEPADASSSSAQVIIPKLPRRSRTWLPPAAMAALLLLAALAYFWLRPPPIPKVANYLQLTHDGQPKSLLGTDGARLYLGLGTGSSASFSARTLAEMAVGGGEPQSLSILPSADMVPLALSPDGSEVLVVDGQGAPPRGPLWSLSILGNSPRRVGDIVAETAAFSPDASSIAYTNLGDLFLVAADGTGARKLASVQGDIKNVAWSPDASTLRFDSSDTAGTLGQQLAWQVSADGNGLHRLLAGWHNPPDECCGKWTPDGRYFVFQSQGQIWALPQKATFLRPAVKPIPLITSPMSLSSPLPSRDGKKLFFIGQTYRGQLMRYDSRSREFDPFLGGVSAEYVDFAKDGQWAAYVSYREGTLWRSRLNGSDRQQLTYSPMYAVLPRWSPDGKQIIFFQFGASADKPARMYEVSAKGGNPELLLPDDPHQQLDPNWSPDGSSIVFAGESNNPASTIRILDLASHQVSELPGSQGLYSPRWSPNGRYIAAFSADSRRILLFDFQTRRWTDLASGSFSWLNWSHGGEFVYVLDSRGGGSVLKIRVSDHQSEQVVSLNNFVAVGRYGGALALAPDDSPLLLRDTGTQDVYSVDWLAP